MLEDSYLIEANIEAATIIKDRLWKELLELEKLNFSNTFSRMWKISDMDSIITYWSIMYYTHGV